MKPFEITREITIDGTPEQVWQAVTTHTAGWLWPTEIETHEGGAVAGLGTILAWEPPHHFVNRMEGEGGWFNQLEHTIEPAGDRTVLRYVHSGMFTDDWDLQYDGASTHTDFYLDTLAQYVAYFAGSDTTYVSVDAPPSSIRADAVARLVDALGAGNVGDRVTLPVGAAGATSGTVDYLTESFVGVRTGDALYRFFGRFAWGGPVSLSAHAFGEGVDADATSAQWRQWLSDLYSDLHADPHADPHADSVVSG